MAFTYTGREWDAEAELSYHRARYYSPNVGRWLSRDPVGEKGGDLNLVAYVLNDPINFFDPFGLDQWTFGDGKTTQTVPVLINKLRSVKDPEINKTIDIVAGDSRNDITVTDSRSFAFAKHADGTVANRVSGPAWDAHNGTGTGSRILFNPNEDARFSPESVLLHEMDHARRINEGTLPTDAVEREKKAIDLANKYRELSGQPLRAYEDHPIIRENKTDTYAPEFGGSH